MIPCGVNVCCGTCEGVAWALVRGVTVRAPREVTMDLVTLQLRNQPGCGPHKVEEDGGVPKETPRPVNFHQGALDQSGGNQPVLKARKVMLVVIGTSAGVISFASLQQMILSGDFSCDSSYTIGFCEGLFFTSCS